MDQEAAHQDPVLDGVLDASVACHGVSYGLVGILTLFVAVEVCTAATIQHKIGFSK